MSLKEKLPLLNSSNKGIRIVGYVVYALMALFVLGVLSGPAPTAEVKGDVPTEEQAAVEEDECMDEIDYSIRVEDLLMQTGYFKKASVLLYKDDRIKITVEPATMGYTDADAIQPYLFGVVAGIDKCFNLHDVELVVKLIDYDVVLEYPYRDALTRDELTGRDWSIEQK